jgi:hypothetical protein
MEEYTQHLEELGFSLIQKEHYSKVMEVRQGVVDKVEVEFYKPHLTVWVRISGKDPMMPLGVIYQGRVRTLQFFKELIEHIQYKE